MFGMTMSSSQAKTLVDFINAEKANYIEEKVKGIPNLYVAAACLEFPTHSSTG